MKTLSEKLILLIKTIIFFSLALILLPAHAEYYLVYSSPEPSELCTYCGHHTKATHKVRHHASYHRSYHHYRNRNGLFVYNVRQKSCPCNDVWTLNYCQCCPQSNRVRSQWGDYVVFSARPVDMHKHTFNDDNPTYSADESTADDSRPDMEIN